MFEFLASDRGQHALRTLNVGAVIPRLSIQDLSQLTIFVPIRDATHQPDSKQLTASAQAIREISKTVLPILQDAENEQAANDVNVQSLQEVAFRLKAIATLLVPAPLSERVVAEYPMPIALAYRRFQEARFNPFEQVFRLRDLFEATSFFLYNALLMDTCRSLDNKKYFIEDAGVRRAYNGYSMAYRLEFVAKIVSEAQANRGQDLFMPELVEVADVIDLGKLLQDELRNRMSHTAAASESQQKNIVSEFQPLVDQVLEKLDFIVQYPLVQIASYSVKQLRFMRRAVVYKGTAPTLLESPMTPKEITPLADSEHLVLLASDDRALDLYPVYQLVANEATRHETHLCFLKQRKKGHLEGESVQANMSITLNGADEFEALQGRLLERL